MRSLSGTGRPDRAPKNQRPGESQIPKEPMKLSAAERKIYREICELLLDVGVLYSVDTYIIADWAKLQAMKLKVYKQMDHAAEPIVQEFDSGATNITGYFSAITKIIEQQAKISSLMGLTPAHRQKLDAFNIEKPALSPLDTFIKHG